MNLTLNLKREYFEQIASGEKIEEFRLATPYWKKRLENRDYEKIVLCLGYPKRGDMSQRIVREWRGAEKKFITHPHFGQDPVEVFAINVQHLTPA